MGTEAAEARTNRDIEAANRALRIGDRNERTARGGPKSPGRSGVGEDRGATEAADGALGHPSVSVGERAGRAIDGQGGDGRAIETVRGICFWTAVVVPVIYVSLLASGINTRSEALLFAGLLMLNAVSLLGGHSYRE